MTTQLLAELGRLIEKGKADQALRKLEALRSAQEKRRPKAVQLDEESLLHVLFLRADALRALKRLEEAATAYEEAAKHGTPRAAKAWHQAGIAHALTNNRDKAILCMQRSVFLDPARAATRYNLCMKLYEHNATSAIPGLVGPLFANPPQRMDCMGLASALRSQSEHDKALQALRIGVQQHPDSPAFLTALQQGLNFACDFDGAAEVEEQLARIPREQHVESHLLQVARCMDERTNIEVAQRTTHVPNVTPFSHTDHVWGPRVKVGYLSSDFFNHATLHLMGGVFGFHDKEKFEIFAYDHSVDDNSAIRKQFLHNVDHHVPIGDLCDKEAAQRIYADGIDVLIDLKGMTEKTRVMLMASRPAPVQMSYLGFPGTSGVNFIDYAITDAIVTPDSSKPWYSEKLCRLPETYQCNDMLRAIDATDLTRMDEHLPANAVVFCCFNQHYKFDRRMFANWCDILKAVPRSVLWLLNPGPIGKANLQKEARKNKVDPLRLVFAERTPQARHLRRIQLADMALDTRIYNGHTTSSDALWAGVPVITLRGSHFASRVSASLLTACGLPELIGTSLEEMARIAVELGNNPEKLGALRRKVEENRFQFPLFDTERFTRHFELALTAVAQRAKDGLAPDHLDIPPLPRRTKPFMTALRTRQIKKGAQLLPDISLEKKGYRQAFAVCPLCGHAHGPAFRKASFPGNKAMQSSDMHVYWVQCRRCNHLCSTAYWTAEGKNTLVSDRTLDFFPGEYSLQRMQAAQVVLWVNGHLPKVQQHTAEPSPLKWVDMYPNTAWCAAAAVDCGFSVTVLAEFQAEQAALKTCCTCALCGDIYRLNIKDKAHVVTLQGALERQPFPELLLERARLALHDTGLLLITFTNGLSMGWQQCANKNSFMNLNEIDRLHLFQRAEMQQLLHNNGLEIVDTLPLTFPEAAVAMLVKKS